MNEMSRPSLLRTIAGWGVGVPFTLLVSVAVLIRYALTGNADTVHQGARLWGRNMLAVCGIRVEVSGAEHLSPESPPVIVIANHQSMFDIFALAGYLPIRFAWIAKNSLFRIPLVGAAMLKAGYIPIERTNRENAHKSIGLASDSLKKHSVVIFPEGTRSRSGAIGRFKRGASYLASHTGAPIVPVTISGSWERMPPEKWLISPGTIHIQIDPPVPTTGLTRDEIDTDLDRIRNIMIDRVEQRR